MKRWQKSILGSGLVLGMLVLIGCQAQVPEKKEAQPRQGRGGGPGGQQRELVSAELQEQLKLTPEQKDKIGKLNAEYTDKTKPINDKLKEAREKGVGFEEQREQFQELQKVRTEYSDKVKALLNDEQKKAFDEANQRRRGGPGGPGGPGGGFGRPAETSLFSSDVQEKLGLSAEQKEKLTNLKKEMDEKSLNVLTAEQKTKWEELKKQPPSRGPRRPPQD